MMKRNLLFLLTFIVSTMTAWAQYSEDSSYYLTLEPNYDGGPSYPPIAVNSPYYWTLSATTFTRNGYTIVGWAGSPDGDVIFGVDEKIRLSRDLTLYAKWGTIKDGLIYMITSENNYEVELMGYDGEKPVGELSVPSSIHISFSPFGGRDYCVTSIGDYAFDGCSSLIAIDIPDDVTSIGSTAFENCTGLTSVNIPNSVTNIGWDAFDGTAWLDSQLDGVVYAGKVAYTYKGIMPENCDIELATGTKGIADCAFFDQSNLTSITIPNSITSIGNLAFAKCSGLTAISVDNNNANYASADGVLFNKDMTTLIACPAQKTGSYAIPSSVTSIESSAFACCSGLTSITIPASVTSIGGSAFSGCTGLTSIIIPDGVTTIGSSAFDGCSSLASINIPNGVTSIESNTFNNCTSLTSVTIPNSVSSIGGHAFEYCTQLTSVTIGSGVTSIGGNAFYGCYNLTSITIPNSVTSIGDYAFDGCTSLNSVYVMAMNPPTHGEKVFYHNAYDRKIYVPANSVGDTSTNGTYKHDWSAYASDIDAFPHGSCGDGLTWEFSGTTLTISGTGAMADYGNPVEQPWKDYRTSITSIVIENGVMSIGNRTFRDCTDLTSVTIPSSVMSIGTAAFRGCTSLTSIDIPSSVTSIGEWAFYGTGLTSVTIPASVTSIGKNAFNQCTGLTSVTIPASVTSIGNNAFSNCGNLATITVDSDNTTYDSRDNCNAIIEKSSNKLVVGCKNTIIPEGVTSIGSGAFYGSGLTSITIPASVTSIDGWAFGSCDNLTSITVYASSCTLGSDAFTYCANLANIYVFSDCLDTYKEGWNQYTSAIEPIPDLTVHDAGGELGSWCTYYNGLADVTVADGTTVYTAKLNNTGGVTLTETGSQIVKKGEAVLLKSSGNITLSSAASAGDGDYTGNELKGVDVATVQTTNKIYYVLSKVGDDFGFFKLASGTNLGVNKAYLAVDAGDGAREFIGFDINAETTAVFDLNNKEESIKNSWYTLDGRKLNGDPKQRGIYVKNGRKIIVK